MQAADHPPLYIVYLAMFSLVGLPSATAHMLASALVGVTTVVIVGLVGRELVGPRGGLIAAALAALYPNMWAYDGAARIRDDGPARCRVDLAGGVRVVASTKSSRAVLLGATMVAFPAPLARAGILMLAVLLLVPLVESSAPACTDANALRQLFTAWIAIGLLIAPWCIYNLTRFERPVLLSGGFEITVDSASCDDTYYGELTGYWSRGCVVQALAKSGLPEDTDRSVLAAMYRDDAVHYIRTHLSRLPIVVAARVGRVTGLWNLKQQAALDYFPGGREKEVAWAAWWSLLRACHPVVCRRDQPAPPGASRSFHCSSFLCSPSSPPRSRLAWFATAPAPKARSSSWRRSRSTPPLARSRVATVTHRTVKDARHGDRR